MISTHNLFKITSNCLFANNFLLTSFNCILIFVDLLTSNVAKHTQFFKCHFHHIPDIYKKTAIHEYANSYYTVFYPGWSILESFFFYLRWTVFVVFRLFIYVFLLIWQYTVVMNLFLFKNRKSIKYHVLI